ncbi:MAG: hypothetical protein AAGA31_14410, partial [Bacteroidota bacterium]
AFGDTYQRLAGTSRVADLLLRRWEEHADGGRNQRVLWDLGLIQAIIHPKWATTEEIKTSPEKGNRVITFYTDIDGAAMMRDFCDDLLNYTR